MRAQGLPARHSRSAVLACAMLAVFSGPIWFRGAGGPGVLAQATRPSAVDAPELTIAVVESRRARMEADPQLDDATKATARAAYQEALQALGAAAKAEDQADSFDRLRADAPRLLEETRAALAALPEQAAIDVPPQASLDALKDRLVSADAAVVDLKRAVSQIEDQAKGRTDRRVQVQQAAAAANARLAAIAKEMEALAASTDPHEIVVARQTALAAGRRAIDAGLDADRRELLSYDARTDLLAARRSLAARKLALAERQAQLWRECVNKQQRKEAEHAAREAREAVRTAAAEHPALLALARENARLTEERTRLAAPIERAIHELEAAEKAVTDLTEQFDATRTRVEKVGVTKAISLLLRKRRADLPDVAQRRRAIRVRQALVSDVQFDLLEAEESVRALTDERIRSEAEAVAPRLKPGTDAAERERIEAAALDLLRTRRTLLESLVKDYERYFGALVDLDGRDRALVALAESFAGYIDEHVLWFPSASPLRPSDARRAWQAVTWFVAPAHWSAVGQALWADVRTNPLAPGIGVILVGALLLLHRRMRKRLRALADLVPRAQTDAFRHTLTGLLMTLLLAAGAPALLWLAGWRLRESPSAAAFPKAVGEGLLAAGLMAFTLNLLRMLCLDGGVGDVHFRWPRPACRFVRRHLRWLIPTAVIAVFIAATLEAQGSVAYRDSLGRAALIVTLLATAVFFQRVCRPSGPALGTVLASSRSAWLVRLKYVWYPLGVAAPAVLAGIAAWGYAYTALELSRRLAITAWLILGLTVGYGLLTRWLFVVRRRLSLREARERREAAESDETPAGPDTAEAPAVAEEPEASLFVLGRQTRELLRSVVAVILLVGLGLIWLDILETPGGLPGLAVWGGVSVAHLIGAAVTVFLTVFLAKNIPGVLEIGLLRHLSLDAGARFAITAIARYTITIAGVVIALGSIGISWSKVQWLAAAITVGLGFGLQEIFANFVSGIIILFERPIRVGDTVTVGETTGTVTRIRIRATTITDWDRKELVVPNKEFITGRLVNWSLSDTILRVRLPVGIAYGSDTDLAERTLLRVARENADVLDDPPPRALFLGFGDSALTFELRVFIPNISVYLPVIDALNMSIDRAFRQAGVTIAFPQRDIHLNAPASIDVRLLAPDRAAPGATAPPADRTDGT